jgi:hypothetical protein
MNRFRSASARGIFGLLAASGIVASLIVAPAVAATRIVEPTTNPYHVTLDASGAPQPFTVAASGFPADANVFAEQCDGRATSDPNWSPTRDCDAGSAPGPVSADSTGTAKFDATNPNRRILVFLGPSPQSIFNCLAPGAPDPKNQLRNFTTCQIRVSTNNAQATADQVFLPIVFGASAAKSSNGESKLPVVLAVVGVLLIAAIAAFVLARSRARTA